MKKVLACLFIICMIVVIACACKKNDVRADNASSESDSMNNGSDLPDGGAGASNDNSSNNGSSDIGGVDYDNTAEAPLDWFGKAKS